MSLPQPKPGQISRDTDRRSKRYVRIVSVTKTSVKIQRIIEQPVGSNTWTVPLRAPITTARRARFDGTGYAIHAPVKAPGRENLSDHARLARIASIIEHVDARAAAVDGPIAPTLSVMTQDEISRIYALAIGKPEAWRP